MTNMRMTTFLASVIAAGVLMNADNTAAEGWKPTKSLEMIVPTGAGGGNDTTARSVERVLREANLLDQPMAVINKPGGGGKVSRAYIAKYEGDAHYLAVAPMNLITNQIIGQAKDSFRDYTPIAILYSDYIGIGVKSDSKYKTIKDLADALKDNPKALSIAIATSVGNQNHIAIAEALKAHGVDIKNLRLVIFNSASKALAAVLGGHVDVQPAPASFFAKRLDSGVRVLAVSAPKRYEGPLAGVPTWKEAGIGDSFSLWRSLIAPKGLSDEQRAYWDAKLAEMAKTPAWTDFLNKSGLENTLMSSAETTKFFAEQEKAMAAILSDLGLVGGK